MEKSLAPLFILKILKEDSDMEHPLTQQKIIDKLDQYGIDIERKAVGRHLSNLESAGYAIEHTKNGVYIENDGFEDSELRLLIDSVLFSKHISQKYAEEIIRKLMSLGSANFRKNNKAAVYRAGEIVRAKNADLFLNIDDLSQAIEADRKVSFDYNEYGTDKKLHVVLNDKIIIDPYQLIAVKLLNQTPVGI